MSHRKDLKPTTYRIIRFEPGAGIDAPRYIGVAWNYDLAVLVSTRDQATYGEARDALGQAVVEAGAYCRWFDGEYVRRPGSDLLEPLK